MTSFWFPDTTVFRSFEAGGRLPWLQAFLGDHGMWTEVIEDEVKKSINRHPGLSVVFDEGWMPEAQTVRDHGEGLQVERFRTANLGGDPKKPTQHLGESETFVIMRSRSTFSDSFFITDDGDAYLLFRKQGIRTMHSLDILKALVARHECTSQEAYDFYDAAWTEGRSFLDSPNDPSYFG